MTHESKSGDEMFVVISLLEEVDFKWNEMFQHRRIEQRT